MNMTTIFADCVSSGQVCLSALPNPTNTGDGGNFVTNALTIVIRIAAAIALLMVVIGGMRYVLARDDPKAAATARSQVIYAAIGLAISILAQLIVIFVVNMVS